VVREVGVVFYDNEEPVRMKGIVHDITEEVESERKIRQIHKMDALGKLAGGIAHDVNNMLLPIISLSELSIGQLPKDDRIRKRLEKILEAGYQAKELISGILTFSRRSDAVVSKSDDNIFEVVGEGLQIIRKTLPATISVDENLNPKTGWVSCDRSQIISCLLNLASNSIDALEGKIGRFEVMLEPIILSDKSDLQKIGIGEGRYALITVRDTGIGMPEDVVQLVFDPFFTTKGVGEGSGLGLAMVYGVIQQHNGAILVHSSEGDGTTFHIYLPLLEQERAY
jgi:signal transduction histidine kinase